MLGHEWAVRLLSEQVGRGEARHAYLFTGPRGVGRRTLALRLAQALNCTQPPAPGAACRVCRACVQIEQARHPDLAIVQSETEGGNLKVDQIRELQRALALHPYEARYRVALLLRFEEANASAMNALLKTLEEPAPKVIILLTAESPECLLPTIVSRCEVLRLRPLPLEQASQGLQAGWGLAPETARLLAHLSGGRPGYALRLHQEPERLERRQACLNDLWRLLAASRVERFAYAETLAKDKDALRDALSVWLSLWRDVLLAASGASTPLTNLDRAQEIERLATRLGLQAAHRTVNVVERTLDLLECNVNARLATEALMLDLPYR
ncbi:MAG: DNA polymerase III subunit delta' [Anaerolineales bacterium]|nr:DNA polymerase III subunit delta' [Anaerolineales bacterium]